ncbi:YadA-like family protein [Acinetobacter guillouiae]|uniref:YadA-like family protein n=1 Tax=Acinetobacter guillouiae TaxID=106649 RepID=UPI001AE2D0EF|nr:YadA-like family protein [Acinetobacter guillouiae]MBP2544439.1 autotransporter adhesin [Acinetobacter guillouiae]
MNKVYKIVWNESLGTWCAISEVSKTRGKRSSAKTTVAGALLAISALTMSSMAGAADHYVSINDGGTQGGNYNNDGATGLNAIAVGVGAKAAGENDIAIGSGAQSMGGRAVVIGLNAGNGNISDGDANVLIGMNAGTNNDGRWNTSVGSNSGHNTKGQRKTALGDYAGRDVSGNGNIGLGASAGVKVTGETNLAAGASAGGDVEGSHNTALGRTSGVDVIGNSNTATGLDSGSMVRGSSNSAYGQLSGRSVTGDSNVAIGVSSGSNISGNYNAALAYGAGNNSVGSGNTALGFTAGSEVNGDSNSAVGDSAGQRVRGNQNTAQGRVAGQDIFGHQNTAVGAGAGSSVGTNTNDSNYNSAFGINAGRNVQGNSNIALGDTAGNKVKGSRNVALGRAAGQGLNNVDDATSLGSGAKATVSNSVALGANSEAIRDVNSEVAYVPLGTKIAAVNAAGGEVSVGTVGKERRISNVAAASQDTDAVNLSQLKAVQAATTTHYFSVNDGGTQGNNYNNDGATGKNALAVGVGASATGESAIAIGLNAGTNNDGGWNTSVGSNSGQHTKGEKNTALGVGAGGNVTGNNNTGLGFDAGGTVRGDSNLAVGDFAGAKVRGSSNTALGKMSGFEVTGSANTATGQESGRRVKGSSNSAYGQMSGHSVTGDSNVAIGDTAGNNVTGNRNVALGRAAGQGLSNVDDATSLGSGAKAAVSNSVALGANSEAVRDVNSEVAYVPLGRTIVAANATGGEVSVGTVGKERRISNVAAASQDTDAVNLSQLKAVQAATTTHYFSVNDEGTQANNYNNDGATGKNALAVGIGAKATGENAIAIGNVSAGAINSIVIGNNNSLSNSASSSTAIGNNNNVTGSDALALGTNNIVKDFSGVAVGSYNNAEGYRSIAVGAENKTKGQWSTAFGVWNIAEGERATVLGANNTIQGRRALGVGVANEISSASEYSSAVGAFNKITDSMKSLTAGFGNTVSGGEKNSVLGNENTLNNAKNTTVLGNKNTVAQENTQVLGNNVTTTQANSVVLGNESTDRAATTIDKVTINGDEYAFAGVASAANGVVSVGKVGSERQIINVAAGEVSASSTDAINGSQLHATNQAVEKLYAGAGDTTHYVSINDSGTQGGNYNNDGATGKNAVAVGVGASATGENAIAIGLNAGINNDGGWNTSVGWNSGKNTKGQKNTALGDDAGRDVTGNNNTGLGVNAGVNVVGDSNLAVGDSAGENVTGNRNVALGRAAGQGLSNVDDATSLGSGAKAAVSNSVALGANSEAIRDVNSEVAYVPRGTKIVAANAAGGEVSVGTVGKERRISNVAAASQDTDAVNLSQLKAVQAATTTHYFSVNDGGTQGNNYKNDGATGKNALAAGRALAGGESSVAIGDGASAKADFSTAVGFLNTVTGKNSTAIGASNNVAQDNTQVLGNNVTTTQANSVVLGNASTDRVATVVDKVSINGEDYAFAGVGSTVNGVVSVGKVGGERQIINVAAGEISASSTDAINGSQLYSTNQAVEKLYAGAGDTTHYVSINDAGNKAGNYNNDGASGALAVAVGVGASAKGDGATALGLNSSAKSKDAVAIGTDTRAELEGSVALGKGSVANTAAGIAGFDPLTGFGSSNTGSTWRSSAAAFSVGDVSRGITRQITGVAAGTADTDAVNVAQLKAAMSKTNEAKGSTETVSAGKNTEVTKTTKADGSTDYQVATKDDVSFDSVTVGNIKADSQNNTISGLADGKVSADSDQAVNGSQLHDTAESVANALGGNAKVNPDGTIKTSNIGNTGKDNVHDAIASIHGQVAGAKTSVSAGKNTVVNSSTNADGSNNYQVALAEDIQLNSVTANQVTAQQVTANKVNVGKVTIDGTTNKVSGLANGEISSSSTDAINGSQLHQTNSSVAQHLGGGSTLNKDGSIGAPTYNVAGGTFHNVGDALGAIDTRVSNLEQAFYDTNKNMDDLRNDTYAGIAGAMAVGNLPQPTEAGMSMVSAGVSGYRGETAVAIGVSAITDSNKIVWKMGASADSRSNIGGAVSMGYQWK